MTYLYLALAIVFEVGWAVGIKLSDGFTRIGVTAATLVMYIFSLVALMLAVRKMDLGVAYATWAGSGMALIALIGIVHFKEPATPLKLASLAMVVAGLVGLNIASPPH
jgi:multidrug transporter EmrE-like cation transporter